MKLTREEHAMLMRIGSGILFSPNTDKQDAIVQRLFNKGAISQRTYYSLSDTGREYFDEQERIGKIAIAMVRRKR